MIRKNVAAALAAILVTNVGCVAASARPVPPPHSVPRIIRDYTPWKDGFCDDHDTCRWIFDHRGRIYKDAHRFPIDPLRFKNCGYCLYEYYRDEGGYDPERISAGFARSINEICIPSLGEPPRTLVILIHGINNQYLEARGSYKTARLQIRSQFPQMKLVFLEVYWDGGTGNDMAAWGIGRESSKWAGLGLRRLLNHLDPGIPIRVLTHSRGAAVITSALWNVPLSEGREWEPPYRAAQESIPLPTLPRLRMGLLVAAMAETDFDRCPADALDRAIVGVNPDDPAVTKGGLPPGMFGSTRLGCVPEAFEYVAGLLNRDREVALRVDLSGSNVHDFKHYLMRRPVEEILLPLLFESDRSLAAARF